MTTVPLQRLLTWQTCDRSAKPDATLLGFCASLARVMIARQVLVTFRPRHLQGFLVTLLAATFLTILPAEAGALLRFALQRFSPSPTSHPSPGSGPHAVGAA